MGEKEVVCVCEHLQREDVPEHVRTTAGEHHARGCPLLNGQPPVGERGMRCSFRYADAGGAFHQCEEGPASGGERCEEHEKEMARLTVMTRKFWALATLRAMGDPWRHDADRLEHGPAFWAEAIREDVADVLHRGHGDQRALRAAERALKLLCDVLRPPNRFLSVDPGATPWRGRADPLAHVLVAAGATDQEAADLFASAYTRAMQDQQRVAETISEPLRFVRSTDREGLGRLVREVWIAWAMEQPAPKSSWLLPWEALQEPDREVDRRIGEAVARQAVTGYRDPKSQEILGVSGPDAKLACPWGCGHETAEPWDFDWRSGVQPTLCQGCRKPVDFRVGYRAERGGRKGGAS